MRSAWRAVCSRWAMSSVVRPGGHGVHRPLHPASVARSRLEVASSRMQDRRVDELGPGQARAAGAGRPTATGPRSPTGVEVAAGQRGDEVVGADGPGRRLDLGVGGVGPAVGDVVADRAREQERLLGHEAELAAVGGEVEVAQVDAVDAAPGRRWGRRSGRRA